MGYDLENGVGRTWGTNSPGWRLALHLAKQFGWRPAGTEPPAERDPGRPWDGRYFGNEGQRVSEIDARNLRAALLATLDSPEFHQLVVDFQAQYREYLEAGSTATVKLTLAPGSAEEIRAMVAELADFCSGGAFEIH